MTISIWRFSHLALALLSGIFLIVASISGGILALEPIAHASKAYNKADLTEISLAETIDNLQQKYAEVVSLEVDAHDFVLVSVITKNGASDSFYINPTTAEKIGTPYKKAAIFKFMTNLHRSLFLKSTGRFVVGIASFLLFLIAITGSILIIKRQQGIRRFFSKITTSYFEQRYHIIIGRLLLIPIIIIAFTGAYLSLEKFNLLPHTPLVHKTLENTITPKKRILPAHFSIFKAIPLAQVKNVVFPFSDDIGDFFQINLTDKEILVNQFNGKIISEIPYAFTVITSNLSLILHTGKGSVLWSIVLLVASCSILFFMYSGFKMTITRKRKSTLPSTINDKDSCEYIILVGSEEGTTYGFAKLFYEALSAANKTVFIGQLNDFTTYDNAKHLIVFTATYGVGEAPSNANKFEKLVKNLPSQIENTVSFSVLGFGSLAYPNYCQFAIEVDALLNKHHSFARNMVLHKINNQSHEAFLSWVNTWSTKHKTPLQIKNKKPKPQVKPKPFEVVSKTEINADNTFLIRLRPKDKIQFQSGDLLSLQPEKNTAARLYSIAKIDNDILLSIKKHEFGLCSNLLNKLSKKETIHAGIKPNPDFHFPCKTNAVILISNGTGIAPFLGMLNENKYKIPTYLFWGGRTQASYKVYENCIAEALNNRTLTAVKLAYSQEKKEKLYVQDLIVQERAFIAKKLKQGAVVMICGSVAMQKELLEILSDITQTQLKLPLSTFKQKKQLKMDCY